MKKFTFAQHTRRLLLGLVLVLVSYASASAAPYDLSWSGLPIVGENPGFLPSGSAVFDVMGTTLTITLTNNNTSPPIQAIGEVLSGLTWDITDSSVSLTGVSALIASGSSLVGVGATTDTDLSSEWP